jgi:putative hydrolase of the HAD superfamily
MESINFTDLDAIIFDLGGVIIEVDMEKPYQKLIQLAADRHPELPFNLKKISKKYETGQLTDRQFRNQLRSIVQISYSDGQIDELWNEMLGSVPSYLAYLLEKIKNKTRTFVLSNTNPIHIREFRKRFKQATGNIGIENYFEKLYFSYEIGLHKPDPKIYKFVLEDAHLQRSRTLFIDDNFDNIKAASSLGLKTIYMNPALRLNEIFHF